MTLLAAWALCYAGLTAVCLAMDRHHRQSLGLVPARRTGVSLRVLGFGMLGLALVQCTVGSPGSTGILAWFGLLTAAGLPLTFLLPYAPRFAPYSALSALAVAGVAFAFG